MLFRSSGTFCPEIFAHVGKRLAQKAKVNFSIYGVITGKQIITIITKYLKK